MADQEIAEAKERVRALRAQVRAEQNANAVSNFEAAKTAKLDALTEEERHLEQQLAEVKATAQSAEQTLAEGTVPDLNVAALGEPVSIEDMKEGQAYLEVVDAHGNLVRVPAPEDTGTQETDAPPPNVPDDATMTGRGPS